jgi:hypothetical protein
MMLDLDLATRATFRGQVHYATKCGDLVIPLERNPAKSQRAK